MELVANFRKLKIEMGEQNMIENFSNEQIEQFLKELGVSQKQYKKIIDDVSTKRTESFLKEEITELIKLFEGKPELRTVNNRGKAYECVITLIAITLNNLTKVTRRNEKDSTEYWKVSAVIKFQDKEEYKQMFREIIDVVKKHNRKWEQN